MNNIEQIKKDLKELRLLIKAKEDARDADNKFFEKIKKQYGLSQWVTRAQAITQLKVFIADEAMK